MLNIVHMKHIKTGRITVNSMELAKIEKFKEFYIISLKINKIANRLYLVPELAKCQRFKSASGSASIK